MEQDIKNVGLCLAFSGNNYGALLQSYATQYIIEKLGCHTEIIDYTRGKKNKYHFSPEAFIYLCIRKVASKIYEKTDKPEILDELHQKNKQGRLIASENFRNRRLKNIVKIHGYEALQEHATRYDAVVIGSDQMWPPDVAFSNYLSLRFAPKGVRRISYATSTGVSEYPWYVKRQAKQFLKEIDFLSVREKAGYEIIKKISGLEAEIVADPAYLLTEDEWLALIPNEEVTKKGYVFSFFLGDNPEMKRLCREYADSHNLRVVSILSNEVNVDDSWYSDEMLISKSPEEFINLIRNAECVITDSFHGFAFSVINRKEVYVSYRVKKRVKSRNQRIDNIVNKFHLNERLIADPKTYVFDKPPIDYNAVSSLVSDFRDYSISYLRSALSKGDEGNNA